MKKTQTTHTKSLLSLIVSILLMLVACRSTQATKITSTVSPTSQTLPSTRTPAPSPQASPSPTIEVPLSPDPTLTSPVQQTPTSETVPPSDSPLIFSDVYLSYSHQQPDGNRFVSGWGDLPTAEAIDIPLSGEARWVVAAPMAEQNLWVAILTDGQVEGFLVRQTAVVRFPITPEALPPGMPPVLHVTGETAKLITPPSTNRSPFSPPAILHPSGERLAFVETNGDVVIWEGGEVARFALNALPDARLLVDEANRILLLTDATTRYGHGVLGDAIEGSSISLIETEPTPRVQLTIPIPAPSVIEGIAPIWADITGDGLREIIVTVSNAEQGAQLVIYNEAGEQLVRGPAIGQGGRWRHQIAVAPFGPDKTNLLVDVLTPHIGGVVEFYQLEAESLDIISQVTGYTSHVIGSRNLDMAVVGDFDGDGAVELLLPNQTRTELGAIRYTPDGVAVVWNIPLEGRLSTNLATVVLPDGRLLVGVGREDGVLRVWER